MQRGKCEIFQIFRIKIHLLPTLGKAAIKKCIQCICVHKHVQYTLFKASLNNILYTFIDFV